MTGAPAPEGPIVLAAGGTGGHVFPAEALARELLARGRRVVLMTDRRGGGFGDRLPGVPVKRIAAGRVDGGAAAKALGAARLVLGTLEAGLHLRRLRPAAVVGFGGYPSVPPLLAASRIGVPTVIHEQNAVLGRANRWLAGRARRIATGFAATGGLPAQARCTHTGNPVRPSIIAIGGRPYVPPGAGEPFRLLVLGGSQGAHAFAALVPGALAALPEAARRRLRLAQQARPEDVAAVTSALAAAGIAAEVARFFDDVPERLSAAHLVIARAGASTAAELAAAGRPALLVPYPFAADDHQSANAAALAALGAAWSLPQSGLDAATLSARLLALIGDPGALAAAAAAARAAGRPDAAARLADLVLAAAGGAPRERAA